ncbi:ABC-type organic anion transporter ABCA8-like [Nymphalis io]|uniref:ABC-type organic anion transporter ABCA8-like n=1 Tax=Inachis io TaxID=171585 RepID=UPI00216A6BB1|nr:ABC-type organic anion transporter ABCA8-like [Nymphalis io]
MRAEFIKTPVLNKLHRHISILIWKSYLQRQRRWRVLLAEALFSAVLFLIAIFIAKPVFLTPLQAVPTAPLTSSDILASLNKKNLLGYAPNNEPFNDIMIQVAESLGVDIISAPTEDDLNNILYNRSQGTPITDPVIWIIWKPMVHNMWKFSIRSTERARHVTKPEYSSSYPHLRTGLLAIQLAISQAILIHTSASTPQYELSMASMPVSPLMQQEQVRRAISAILLCYTLALLPPVLETESLVVSETISRFKRSLCIRGVDYSSMYFAWFVFALMTALPVCLLGSIALILIFRWIHLLFAMTLVLVYVSVMIMLALIMAMFHNKPWIACVWSTLFTLLQTFLAELIVHHKIDLKHEVMTFFLHLIIPPLGLMHGLNEFALLQTRQEGEWEVNRLLFTIVSWLIMIVICFGILMLLQRTVKQRTIGGQMSWKSIVFRKTEDLSKLHRIENPTGNEREKLQEVDELVAKAISFRGVSKSFMGGQVLSDITLDIYRNEFTILYSEPIQSKMITTIEDLLTGLTYPDKGSINVLGEILKPGRSLMAVPNMMGYCHRSGCLVEDLTVEEHLTLYCFLCLWNEPTKYVIEYSDIRIKRLLSDCDLEGVRYEYVRNLDAYYQALLCWAIAILLEPRIIIIPVLLTDTIYTSVIKDKIMRYKKYLTIVKLCFTSISVEFADRVFIFDNRVLVRGGTPAYIFFKYGREYRVRLTLRSAGRLNEDNVNKLLQRTSEAGATIRAHLGSLLILRLPASPTANVAALISDLTKHSHKYGIVSMNISLPDSEEVCNRAIYESRAAVHGTVEEHEITRNALNNLSEPIPWRRKTSSFGNLTHLSYMAWKFIDFYRHYRFYFIITVLSALVAGVFIGLTLATVLVEMERDRATKTILHGEMLTVESLELKTNLILRSDNSSDAKSVANSYVFSETNATEKQIENMHYTALFYPESLTEYLVTRAIDSPQQYVYMFAYGLDVASKNDTLNVQVLYSPMHYDQGAAARSLARAFMALIRHYTLTLDASIEVTDDPLALDLSTWLKTATAPPIFIQFLLILTISHITILPSKESGFIRHMQVHAMNFSPARYWCTLFLCDFMLYCFLVFLMTATMIVIMALLAPMTFYYSDLVVVPLMLTVYGIGCIPQAYLFSLGPQAALNTMTFVILNLVFGETTVIAKLLYGNALNYVLNFMSLSPQFNMAYAFVKIKKIFLYNSECIVFKRKNLCSSKTLHKCCPKCGVLQQCFSRRFYLNKNMGVLMEMIAILCTTVVFMALLLLWEYKYIQRLWTFLLNKWVYPKRQLYEAETQGAIREREDVLNKQNDLKNKQQKKINTYGEYLLACNVSKKIYRKTNISNVYFGLGKGEALAISGLLEHGRLELCEILAGYKLPNEGDLWCSSKWTLSRNPHMYARQVTFSCDHDPLPLWMTVYRALEMITVLRGVPQAYVKDEVMNYIDALELHQHVNTRIRYLPSNERSRLKFAAAVVGAPPVVILDECTAYQKYSVTRAMYYILYNLRKRGHAIVISSSRVESHLPVTSRLAILVDGHIYDIDEVDMLVERYSDKGFTVVLHLKDEVNVKMIFSRHFKSFVINDISEVLVNVQVLDPDLTWASIFEKMEALKVENRHVYSYIVSAIPIDYIYNTILSHKTGHKYDDAPKNRCYKYLFPYKPMVKPSNEKLAQLIPFERRFNITKLKELPWSVIFNR